MIETAPARAEMLAQLHRSTPGSDMGALLRQFWQPVALSSDLAPSQAKPLRMLGEDLTLYRGASGRAYLIGGRCAHRLTALHTGWIEGEQLRCVYHGWKYGGDGQCVEMPAEKEDLASTVRIAGYAVHEYCGLVFAYVGEQPAPPFELPRKDVFERDGYLYFARRQVWPCNWLQQVENSMDAVHVSFVHQLGKVGLFGEAVSTAVPELAYEETPAGIRQTATRAENNVRISDWTYPNNNHILLPSFDRSLPWVDLSIWLMPTDDEQTARFQIYAIPSVDAETDRRVERHFEEYGGYDAADHHDELIHEAKFPSEPFLQLTSAQDYVAVVGQGAVVDRPRGRLGKSDEGIALLRRIFLRELEAMRAHRPMKEWRKLDEFEELPRQGAMQATA
jgi:5,5'-dehydrodivanillate O-demethylase